MTSAKFKVVPVRRRDGASGPWIMTDEHKAQAWAVGCFRRGQHVLFMVHSSNKAKAAAAVTGIQRMFEGPSSGYRLGKRMGPRTGSRI